MVLEVSADTRQMRDDWYAQLAQRALVADTGQHQGLGVWIAPMANTTSALAVNSRI